MKILCESLNQPNIIHFQGFGSKQSYKSFFERCSQEMLNNKFEDYPEDLTIVTTFTNKMKSPLVYQLENNDIPYLNSYDSYKSEKFRMIDKIYYISDALNKVKTEKVLILDGYDVLIQNFKDILQKFESYQTKILWNSAVNNFPDVVIDQMPWRDYIGHFNHFNAGCCIGYTKDVFNFYEDCQRIMSKISNPYGSEQFLLRHVWKNYCGDMLKPNNFTTIDYKCLVFMCMCQTKLTMPNDKQNIYIVS